MVSMKAALPFVFPASSFAFFREGGNISVLYYLRGVLGLCSQMHFQKYITGINPRVEESI